MSTGTKILTFSPEQVMAGVHSMKVTLPVIKNEIKWGNIRNQAILSRKPDGGIVYRWRVSNELWITRVHLKLYYHRFNYLVIRFEPTHDDRREGTDILEYKHWLDTWADLKQEICELTENPNLFDNDSVRLKKVEFSFDVFCDDKRSVFIRSIRDLPLSGPVRSVESEKDDLSFKRHTKRKTRELSVYDREEKSKGFPFVRIEFRLEGKVLDTALQIPKDMHAWPECLADKERVDYAVTNAFRKACIWPGCDIVPLHVAKKRVQNTSVRNLLDSYSEWRFRERPRYPVNRLRDIENLVIGSDESEDVATVTGLYEAMMGGYENAW